MQILWNLTWTKPGNLWNQIIPKNPLLVVLFRRWLMSKTKISYEGSIMNMKRFGKFWMFGKLQTWSFQLRKLAPNWHFWPWAPHLCPPKSIITAQIHVKFILTHIILAKVLQQPILMVPMDYGSYRYSSLKIRNKWLKW